MALLAEHLLRPLPADKQIETGPFLEAVSHLPPFFDCLGSPVFTPIKADISGNITVCTWPGSPSAQIRTLIPPWLPLPCYPLQVPQAQEQKETRKTGLAPSSSDSRLQKIKAVYDTNPTKFRTLQNILEVEKEMYGAEWPKVGATLALMWLKRGLRFIQVFLQSICDGERDENHPNLIRVNATKAYEMALKKYHGWIVQKIFQAALYAAPYKSDFLKALSKGQNVTEEECLEKVRLFLVNYTATIDVIYEMYTRMNAELNYKV
uniref:Glycolipid transfer protein n=1 Tax=Ovis aries TaxID=9940 RepID=A0AC11DWB9_SHEEP